MVYSNKFVMCVLVNGKVQKELANGEVQIPFNTEYVLRFRNKHNRRAVVNFSIDGEDVSGSGYVIPANGYVDIKRHSYRDAAFVLVPLDSPEAVDAGKNGPNHDKSKGVIEARFTLEKEIQEVREIHHHHHHDHYRIYPDPYAPKKWPSPWRKDTWEFTDSGTIFPCSTGDAKFTFSNTVTASNNAEASYSKSIDQRQLRSRSKVEDGCTVEGSFTGQRFTTTYVNLEETSSTLRIFLRGYHESVPQEAEVQVRAHDDHLKDLIAKRDRIKKEHELADEKKKILEEIERLEINKKRLDQQIRNLEKKS